MQKDIFQKWFFPKPPAEVWDYLTRAELIEQWLDKSDFKPVVGHRFQFTNSCQTGSNRPHYTFCRVLEIIPCKLLSYSWQKGANEKEISVDSVVTWTLTEKDGGTELHLRHNGFTLIEDTVAHSNGWNSCLNRMTGLLNSPAPAPPPPPHPRP